METFLRHARCQIRRSLRHFFGTENIATDLFLMRQDMSTVKELLAKLADENQNLKTVQAGVETTFKTMSAALKDALEHAMNTDDLSLLENLVTEFDARGKEIAASITANTAAASESTNTAPVSAVTPDTPLAPEPTPVPAEETVAGSPSETTQS